MIIVGMQVQCDTWCRAISRPASSRSQRGSITVVVAPATVPRQPKMKPVMWNIGTTPRLTASGVLKPQMAEAITLCISVRWVCMQPLGRPVVPLV